MRPRGSAGRGGAGRRRHGARAAGYRVSSMGRVFGGAALVIAGIVAFIEAPSNRPAVTPPPYVYKDVQGIHEVDVAVPISGSSQTAYDLLRIGAWALVIIGVLLIVVGLIGYWGAQREGALGGR